MKIPPFLKSKKFYTLIASIIAALSAYFLSSCSAQYVEVRSGRHDDSVYVYKVFKTRNNY